MYPVIVAHANDHAAPDSYIQVSGGLLLVYGVGAIVGPLIAGAGMSGIGVSGLFLTTIVVHLLIIAFSILRIARRAPVEQEHKVDFVATPMARMSTPETAVLSMPEEEEQTAAGEKPDPGD